MEDTPPRPDDSSETDVAPVDHTQAFNAQRIVWGIVSAAFIGYLLFGKIETRIWSFGRLSFKDRQIRHVWAYFGDRLPDMPGSALMPVLFYLSLVVLVVGTVVGLWFFLIGDGDTVDPAVPVRRDAQDPKLQPEEHV